MVMQQINVVKELNNEYFPIHAHYIAFVTLMLAEYPVLILCPIASGVIER